MNSVQRKAFGHRLRELRISLGKSQIDIARKVYISRTCLSNYELGKRFPATNVLCELAKFFEVDVSYLISDNKDSIMNEVEYYRAVSYEQLIEDKFLDLSGLSFVRKIELIDYLNYLKQQDNKKTGGIV